MAACCRWVNDKSPATMVMGFDQEAAAVLTARLASWKMETEEDFDATRCAACPCRVDPGTAHGHAEGNRAVCLEALGLG